MKVEELESSESEEERQSVKVSFTFPEPPKKKNNRKFAFCRFFKLHVSKLLLLYLVFKEIVNYPPIYKFFAVMIGYL